MAMSKPVPSPEIALLLRILDEAYDRKGWHGPTLRGAIRRVSAEEALWRPQPGRHHIWEIVLHTAYWKYAVRRRLRGEKRGSFSRKGSNWLALPQPPTVAAWRADVALLDAVHRELRDAVVELAPARLREKSKGSEWENAAVIYGIAAHDVYHTGQIQLLKRLQRR
ncbi:MAG: DinB family protein [Gemmatimonadetes bacterium]|nr:DinB family protein [Gemmatimonadota bacterium]